MCLETTNTKLAQTADLHGCRASQVPRISEHNFDAAPIQSSENNNDLKWNVLGIEQNLKFCKCDNFTDIKYFKTKSDMFTIGVLKNKIREKCTIHT